MFRRLTSGLIIVFLMINGSLAYCQEKPVDESVVLEKLFKRLNDNFNDEDRLRINDSIKTIVDSYVGSDSIFNHRFNNLKYLGQIKPPDSDLKIITWNLVLRNSPGKYYCYFIRKQKDGTNNVTRLVATYNDKPIKTDTVYTESDWYGALYYDLRPYEIKDKRHWVLLGIDYGNPEVTRKIIEVLSFTPEGSAIFGKRIFMNGNEIRYREVFEYASTGMMSLRFKNDKTIIFDHLVPVAAASESNRLLYGSDYSFDAYKLKKTDMWQMEINVDARNDK